MAAEQDKDNIKELESKVNDIVIKAFDKHCMEVTCTDSYYKNLYIKYAVKQHASLQCIVRTYAECLHTGASISPDKCSDLYHANQILTFLQNYANSARVDYLRSLLTDFLQRIKKQKEYIILSCFGRTKSFRSVEAKIRYKLSMIRVLNTLIQDFYKIPELAKFGEDARTILLNNLNSVKRKNPTKDLLGVRFVVDKIDNTICSEADLITYCYYLKDELVDFFDQNGIDLIEEKDYIYTPKTDTGYQSIHLVFQILEVPIEIQIRTSKMHYVAEYGTANHDSVYKDTYLQNWTRELLYDLSPNYSRVSNELNGLLKSFNFFEQHISKTRDVEIPSNPLELDKTSDKGLLDFIQEIF